MNSSSWSIASEINLSTSISSNSSTWELLSNYSSWRYCLSWKRSTMEISKESSKWVYPVNVPNGIPKVSHWSMTRWCSGLPLQNSTRSGRSSTRRMISRCPEPKSHDYSIPSMKRSRMSKKMNLNSRNQPADNNLRKMKPPTRTCFQRLRRKRSLSLAYR